MNTDNFIKALTGGVYKKTENDSVPDYLAPKYDREGAAVNLGELGNNDPRVLGALCRACLLDEEGDVRLASLEALEKLDRKIATTMAHSLLQDEDDSVQELASFLVKDWATH